MHSCTRTDIETPVGCIGQKDQADLIRGKFLDGTTKEKINNLIWNTAHPEMSIFEADDMACSIHEILHNKFNTYEPGE